MERTLDVLLVEDMDADAELVLREVKRAGWKVSWRRVEDEESLREAMTERSWDVVLSDFNMPRFNGMAALAVVRERWPDTPFILVSGTIGEETAVIAMKAGAHDYVLKDNLKRLNSAIERGLSEAQDRRNRRRAEQALIASEARFRSLVTSMQDTVFTLDHDLRFTDVYGNLMTDDGRTVEPLGKKPGDVFRVEVARHYEEASVKALRGERVVFEWSVDGTSETRHFQTSLSPLRERDSDITGLVGVTRETTEQKRAETQLFVSDRMASVGSLAAGVAHEINNPLAAVLANLDFAREDTARLVDSVSSNPALCEFTDKVKALEEPLHDAMEAANGVRQIVKDLKIFSRAGDEEHRGAVDIRRVLDSSARMAWNEIRHRANLVKEIDEDVPRVFGNESRLGQVFLNLIVNAAQAIPEGRAKDNEIRIKAGLDKDGRVSVEVRDTGPGIPPEVARRIFTPFFTTKPVGVGTGLGLSICQRIVTSLGGTISFDTVVGKGTTMRVVLPVPSNMVAAPESVPRLPRVAARRGQVLVVDDEPLIGAAIRRTLSKDHEITVVTNVADALALLPTRKNQERAVPLRRFDLILCDVMMPDLTGIDLYVAVKEASPETAARIVFLTGGAFTPAARQFLDEVKNPRFEKPFDTNQLRAFVNARLR